MAADVASGVNLLVPVLLSCLGRGPSGVFLFLGFLGGLVFDQGLSDLAARLSLSRAVPYFSSLAGHLLASAGWLCSTLPFPKQLAQRKSCGQNPSADVSMVSPNSWASRHFWQSAGSLCWWFFSSWGPLHILQHWSSLHLCVGWSSRQQFLH